MTKGLLARKALFDEYVSKNKIYLSSYSFVSIFGWQDFFEFDLQVIDGNLCVFAKSKIGIFLYLPPLGPRLSLKAVDRCFSIMEKHNGLKGITRIENVSEGQLPFFPKEKYSYFKKAYEYCYFKDDIVSFEGNDYKSKRSSYNQFVKNYKFQYLPFHSDMEEQCAQLYAKWAQGRRRSADDIYLTMLEENAAVHRRCIKYFKELGLVGRVVLVDDKVKAYSFGYPLNKDIFCVLFEIADVSIKGIATFIFRKFCGDKALKKFLFINVMDDFELKNIEQAKMSFRPSLMLPSYAVSRR